jgi:hypothetical protein
LFYIEHSRPPSVSPLSQASCLNIAISGVKSSHPNAKAHNNGWIVLCRTLSPFLLFDRSQPLNKVRAQVGDRAFPTTTIKARKYRAFMAPLHRFYALCTENSISYLRSNLVDCSLYRASPQVWGDLLPKLTTKSWFKNHWFSDPKFNPLNLYLSF